MTLEQQEQAPVTRKLLNKITVICRCGTPNDVKVPTDAPALFQCTNCEIHAVVKLEPQVEYLNFGASQEINNGVGPITVGLGEV